MKSDIRFKKNRELKIYYIIIIYLLNKKKNIIEKKNKTLTMYLFQSEFG
jgi:hypothetical protein